MKTNKEIIPEELKEELLSELQDSVIGGSPIHKRRKNKQINNFNRTSLNIVTNNTSSEPQHSQSTRISQQPIMSNNRKSVKFVNSNHASPNISLNVEME